MSKYNKKILPLIINNFNLKNPNVRFIEITDFILELEFVIREKNSIKMDILYTYSIINFN